jgi:3-isopropylmalate/(R)-2-methylmalate dehydratase large subunit
MGQTITEKLIASHAGLKTVKPGQFVEAKVDAVLANDITAPGAIDEFKKVGVPSVFNSERIYLIPDHFTPSKDIASAEQVKKLKQFAQEQGITNYFEVGRMGIEHALLPEEGLVVPGDLIIGADSHTCTYGALGAFATGVGSTDVAAAMATGKVWLKVPPTIRFNLTGKLGKWVTGKDVILYIIGKIGVSGALYCAMEFSGEGLKELSMDSRFTITNMVIEAGAKNGVMEPDSKTLTYVDERAKRSYQVVKSDPDCHYKKVIEVNLGQIELQVAFPFLPSNTRNISEIGEVLINQVVIGSCTNGRLEDLRMAASILKGKKVHKNVRLIIIPATQKIYLQALKEGLLEIFVEAGGAVSTPTCGPCLGGHMGVLAEGERALATTNRNFVGRMGHPKSEVYLAGPAVAAATAVTGQIASPEEI